MSVVTATLKSDGNELPPEHQLVSIDVVREVNRIPGARLVLLDGGVMQDSFDASKSGFFDPGKEIEVLLRYEGESDDESVFKGLVVRHSVEQDPGASTLCVELKDAALKMTQARQSAVYQEQTDDKVMKTLIGDSGLTPGSVEATQVEHASVIQYDCTAWDFLVSRAEANGLLVACHDGAVDVAPMKADGSAALTFEYGLTRIHAFEIEVDGRHQFKSMESVAWDAKKQELTKATKAADFSLSQSNVDVAALAPKIGGDSLVLTSATALTPEELQAWADARLARNRLSLLRGRFSVPGVAAVKLLDVVELTGFGERFDGTALVTGVRHQVDTDGWVTHLQFGLRDEWLTRETNVANAGAAGLLPPAQGLQIGVVQAFEEDPEGQLRVQVVLPGVDEQPIWARLTTPDAGEGRGFFFRPEPGDEVVVGFLNDDPRQPVVVGSLFSAKNTPPEGLEQPTEDNHDKGIVSRDGLKILFNEEDRVINILTAEQHRITLDENAGSIEIEDVNENKIVLNADGVEIKSAGDIKLAADGDLKVEASNVEITGSGDVKIQGSQVEVA